MEQGGIALVNYGEIPRCWHTRLLLSHLGDTRWVIATPDLDVYDEDLSIDNEDYTDFHYSGVGGQIPPRISARSVYGFAPMNAAQLGQLMAQGRAYAAAMGVQAPPNPAPQAAAAGVANGPGGVVASMVAGLADRWVAMEKGGPYDRGDVVSVDPVPLPQGSTIVGDRAILLVNGVHICLRKMTPAEVSAFVLDDLRVLPVHFDSEGVRRRAFSMCVERMSGETPQGGGLQLTGPPTCLNLMKSMRDQGFTPVTFHEHWMRSSEIPKGDRSTYEHEVISRVLESFACVDQLNLPALQGVELLCRRLQVIREAHRISPSSPDYSAADHFMGWKYRKSGQGVDSGLAQHVANELKAEASIAKEARKAREEQEARRRRPPPKKGGEGGQDK